MRVIDFVFLVMSRLERYTSPQGFQAEEWGLSTPRAGPSELFPGVQSHEGGKTHCHEWKLKLFFAFLSADVFLPPGSFSPPQPSKPLYSE